MEQKQIARSRCFFISTVNASVIRKRTVIFGLSFLLGQFCWMAGPACAQNGNANPNPSLNNFTPPSPNAASLGKFGDVPVGYTTGIPQISVPIYSYSNPDNTLGMSISLDYHAGGIKVDEVASNVGIGFALNAGGVITRTQRGIADEIPVYGFVNRPSIPDETEGNRYNGATTYLRMNVNEIDSQNDVFNFNFNGQSGKFMFGKNGDFLMLTPSKIRVESEMGATPMSASVNFKKFTITDEQGVKYIFDEMEITRNPMGYGVFNSFVSSWYLTKVIAPFSTDSIEIQYDQEKYRYIPSLSASETIGIVPFPGTRSGGGSEVDIEGKRVKKIIYPNKVTVNFIYDETQRTDLPQTGLGMGLYRLKQITITDGVTTRGYNLHHNYSLNRLTLSKVVPFSGAEESRGYTFDYFTESGISPAALPNRLSFQQDHWGFYNNNPGGLIPHEYFKISSYRELPGGNREVHTERVKYGSLSRMTYPTGGYTEFEMEANVADDFRLRRDITLKHTHVNGSLSIACSNTTPGSESFTFNGDPGSYTKFSISFYPGSYACADVNNCKLIAEIRNNSNTPVTTQQIPFTQDLSVYHEFSLLNLAPGTYTCHLQTQGVTNFQDYVSLEWTEIREQNPDSTVINDYRPYVGGLRVKAIRDYDGIKSTPVTSRLYDYVKEDGTSTAGGLGTYPVYTHGVYYDDRLTCDSWSADGIQLYFDNGGIPNAIVRSSSAVQSLAMINGSPVNYSRVVEKFTNNGVSNGMIIRYFDSYVESPLPEQINFPYTPPDYLDYGYGQLRKEIILDKNLDTLKVTRNDYVITQDNYYTSPQRYDNFRSISLVPVKYELNFAPCPGGPPLDMRLFWQQVVRPIYFLGNSFVPNTGRKDLSRTLITEYSGTEKLTTEILYTRDDHYNLKTTTTSNSKGELTTQRLHYPYEYTVPVAVSMVQENMLALPVSEEIWKTKGTAEYLVGGRINNYQEVSSGIRKSSIDDFESATPVPASSVPAFNAASFNRSPSLFKESVIFRHYSEKGFIAEQAKKDDVIQSVIWDYNMQFPVAVVNALNRDVAFTSFEGDGTGNWTINNTVRNSTDALTGRSCYQLSNGAISKTNLPTSARYVVSYWSKNGSYSIGGGTVTTRTGRSLNGWTHYEHQVQLTGTMLSVSGSGLIDELRLYPVGAQMTTYTYDPATAVTSMTDANNLTTFYEYDGLGRLVLVKDAARNIVKKIEYNYKVQ